MLDIVIPAYEDLEGLKESLSSIGHYFKTDQVHITIVDDCSPSLSLDDYKEAIKPFEKYLDIKVGRLHTNVGPGVARQFGYYNSHHDYVTFLDCGDVYNSPLTINTYLNKILQYPDVQMFHYGVIYHYPLESGQIQCITVSEHETFHGVVFKRQFLQDRDLKFAQRMSYAHEDIAFIKMCMFITKFNQAYLDFPTTYAILHTYNENSLTQKEDGAWFAQQIAKGYLENAMEMLEVNKEQFNCTTMPLYIASCLMDIYYLMELDNFYSTVDYENDLKILSKFYHEYYLPNKLSDFEFNQMYYSKLSDMIKTIDCNVYHRLDIQEWFDKIEKIEYNDTIIEE